MKFKNLFRTKKREISVSSRHADQPPMHKIDLDSLDACVGGRGETEGVGCYMQSGRTGAH